MGKWDSVKKTVDLSVSAGWKAGSSSDETFQGGSLPNPVAYTSANAMSDGYDRARAVPLGFVQGHALFNTSAFYELPDKWKLGQSFDFDDVQLLVGGNFRWSVPTELHMSPELPGGGTTTVSDAVKQLGQDRFDVNARSFGLSFELAYAGFDKLGGFATDLKTKDDALKAAKKDYEDAKTKLKAAKKDLGDANARVDNDGVKAKLETLEKELDGLQRDLISLNAAFEQAQVAYAVAKDNFDLVSANSRATDEQIRSAGEAMAASMNAKIAAESDVNAKSLEIRQKMEAITMQQGLLAAADEEAYKTYIANIDAQIQKLEKLKSLSNSTTPLTPAEQTELKNLKSDFSYIRNPDDAIANLQNQKNEINGKALVDNKHRAQIVKDVQESIDKPTGGLKAKYDAAQKDYDDVKDSTRISRAGLGLDVNRWGVRQYDLGENGLQVGAAYPVQSISDVAFSERAWSLSADFHVSDVPVDFTGGLQLTTVSQANEGNAKATGERSDGSEFSVDVLPGDGDKKRSLGVTLGVKF